MAKLKSRALLSSFAATAVIAGIGGLATQAHAAPNVIGNPPYNPAPIQGASLYTIMAQCAPAGTKVGNIYTTNSTQTYNTYSVTNSSTTPSSTNTGELLYEAVAPVIGVGLSSTSFPLPILGAQYGNVAGTPEVPQFQNTFTLTNNSSSLYLVPSDYLINPVPASYSSYSGIYYNGPYTCETGLKLHLSDLNPSTTLVEVTVTTNQSGISNDNFASTTNIVNGSADVGPIDVTPLINNPGTSDTFTVALINDPNQVMLPETVKLSAYLVGSNGAITSVTTYSGAPGSGTIYTTTTHVWNLNTYPLFENRDFIKVSSNATLLFIPSAYVPFQVGSYSNAIQAAYITITAPTGISASDIGIYLLNRTDTGNESNIRYCGTLAQSSSTAPIWYQGSASAPVTGQGLNQYIVNLGALASFCNITGAAAAQQFQAGIPLLFVVKADGGANANSPLNVTADGYSIFNLGSSYYMKRLPVEAISGDPSVGTMGGSEASYAH